MGRKLQYQAPKTIRHIKRKNNYTFGFCHRCNKWIKSSKWSEHLHDGFVEQMNNLALRCSIMINQLGKTIQRTKIGWIDHSQAIRTFQREFQASFQKFSKEIIQTEKKSGNERIKTKKIAKKPKKSQSNTEIRQVSVGIQKSLRVQQSFKKLKVQKFMTNLELPSALQNWKILKSPKSLKKLKKLKLKFKKNVSMTMKTCYECKCKIFTSEGTKIQCQYCQTLYHEECCPQQCFCSRQNRRVLENAELESSLIQPLPVENIEIALPSTLKLLSCLASAQDLIIQENIKLLLRDQYHLSYTRQALFYDCPVPDLLNDPQLQVASPELEKVYSEYASGKHMIRVAIKKNEKTGNGVYALKDIPRGTFICQYATDIIPMCCAHTIPYPNYSMDYVQGGTSQQELVLTPINYANWAILINHSTKRANCKTLRIIIDGVIRVILYSKKAIKLGEELRYNYNGEKAEFDTKKFK